MSESPSTVILAAFSLHTKMCMHVLQKMTGLHRNVLKATLAQMVRDGLVRKVSVDDTDDGDLVYTRTQREAYIPLNLGMDEEHAPVLLGLNEDEARTRVHMLQFMKERLIDDWHPVIDKLIADYQRGLKYIASLRVGADD